ncbi:MAG: class I SAM-dependent methyltransferase [Opitutus sp.]|nr:class I SAM-dependent methyltransferase [Opitutus sp.]
MTHEEKIARWTRPGQIGAEIGAGDSPAPGLDPAPIYVDCFKSFGTAPNRADFYGHACALPFHSHTLDYVIASHVLEHVANPVAALAEWYRVLKPGGIIYLVVPNRRAAWDHQRELTPVTHLLEDFQRGTTARDATHIDEFTEHVDWSLFSPDTPVDEVPTQRAALARGLHETIARGEDINIHFHTFEPANLRELIETLAAAPAGGSGPGRVRQPRPPGPPPPSPGGPGGPALPSIPRFNWEIVDFADGFPSASPNGVLAILRVRQGWRARADAEAFRIRTGGDPRAVLRSDAQPFAVWAANTVGLGGVK